MSNNAFFMKTSSNSGSKGSNGYRGTGGKGGKDGYDAKCTWCNWDKNWGCTTWGISSKDILYNTSYHSDGKTP